MTSKIADWYKGGSLVEQYAPINTTASNTTISPNNYTYSYPMKQTRASSSSSSDGAAATGFFLFVFGIFLCSIFLYMLADRIYRRNGTNQSTTTTTPSTTECDPENVFNAMSMKERRHYIDIILKVKTYKASTLDDIEASIKDESQIIASSDEVQTDDDNSIDVETAMEVISINDSDPCIIDEPCCSVDIESIIDSSAHQQLPCCVICLERFHIGDEISYSIDPLCAHEYHTTCIVEWLMKHPNCPYCRRLYIPLPSPPPPPIESSSTDIPTGNGVSTETNTTIMIATQLQLQRNYNRMNNHLSI